MRWRTHAQGHSHEVADSQGSDGAAEPPRQGTRDLQLATQNWHLPDTRKSVHQVVVTAAHRDQPLPLGDSNQRGPKERSILEDSKTRRPPCEQQCYPRKGVVGGRHGLHHPPNCTPAGGAVSSMTDRPSTNPNPTLKTQYFPLTTDLYLPFLNSASSPKLDDFSTESALLGAVRWPALTRLPETPSPPDAPTAHLIGGHALDQKF